MSFRYFAHSDIHFGQGALAALTDVLRGWKAQRVFVACTEDMARFGMLEKTLQYVQEAGAQATVFSEVEPNPTNDQVELAAEIARKADVDAIVALGGGSSMDFAKAVNILLRNPGPIGRYGGVEQVPVRGVPLVAIPTTAGTSSEITNVIALIDTQAVCKYVIIDNKNTPDCVIADPELTRTVPPSVTAATGMDAITHAVESYISNMATPLTAYHSIAALGILYENLPLAVADGGNMAAREQMMLGCIVAGYAFSNANLGLVHGIAHTLSAHFGLAHGAANAAVLPEVLEYNAQACPEKMAELAAAVGLEKTPTALAAALRDMRGAIGIKKLRDQGVPHEALAMLADETLKEPVLGFNPRQGVTHSDVLAILEAAW